MERVRTVILLYEPGRKKDTLVSLSAGDTKLYSKYADVQGEIFCHYVNKAKM